jgi:hypothetical protein
MRRFRFLGVFVSVLAVASATAQQSSPPTAQAPRRDPHAITMLQESSQLLGPQATSTLNAQNSVVVSGTYQDLSDPTSASFAVRAKILGANQVRWEFDQPSGTVATVVSSAVGWRTGPDGTVGLALGDMMGRQLEALPFLALADWLADPNVTLMDVGPETIDGIQLHHVTLAHPYRLEPSGTLHSTYQTVSTCELYFDTTTNLPARMRFKQYPRDIRVSVPIELTFSGYKQLSGFQVPTTVGYSINGHVVGEYHFDSIALNASVAASDFEVN